jgi:Ca-activated chloride channel family protein
VFFEEGAALCTIAKDVKLQLEFDPRQVASYRLIGYENRMLRTRDFEDDRKDAGDMGAGHTVTALYELAMADDASIEDPLVEIRLRCKDPEESEVSASKLLKVAVTDSGTTLTGSSADFKFAAAVAQFGLLLRDSPHKGTARFSSVLQLAREGRGEDDKGHRAEFLRLAESAEVLAALK